ncbi:endo-1,4-beta-xylanase [Thermophagus sp. OGC60D27]|uniref:endo-1,4-beta-xylanase n=1 Tax=Thermophagus sp. OGC60D27 TaxID=3458415 RepID=UPI00403796F7
MRHKINALGVSIMLLVLASSCVDDTGLEYDVQKPESIQQVEYLNDYDALKTYVDRSANPDFKLGAGVTASKYSELGLEYRVMNSNFDEITAGNAMKYGSVVQDDGSMDFAQVVQFVGAAKEANTEIYGHTLVWHAQQNKVYLESIIADQEVEIDPNDANNALHISTSDANANIWDWQLNYVLPTLLTQGVEYTLKMRAKASENYTVAFWRYDGSITDYGPDFSVGDSWSDVSITFTPSMNATTLQFCFGTFAGDLYFDDMELTAAGSEENMIENGAFDNEVLTGWEKPSWHAYTFEVAPVAAGPATWWTNLVTNSDVESDDLSSFKATESTVGPNDATIGAPGTGADGVGRAIVVQTGDNPSNPWDSQFFITVPYEFSEGEKYRFSMKIRAEKPAPSESQAHAQPGQYLHWSMVGSPNFTTEWQEYSNSGEILAEQDGMSTIAFNLAVFEEANTYYFDDIYFEIEESGNKISLTDEEKADTLTYALDKWIAGMMEATNGYVKSWDVVNEPISGEDNDGDGFYDLQSADTGDPENNFYWQDYLGDNYVRIAVKLAREYGPGDMKLFVNDYNLESDWDDNQKLKSLIHWIEQWESDGETIIDGIGTQMHVSYHMNPETQASKEEHIVQMYELLAETGKLVKITELDMGLVDENGDAVMIDDGVTQEQHMAMAEFYNFIIRKYFEIIPANQRYGIAHWSPADPPSSSSWRGGEPIGLWTENFDYRKHTYVGFAEGLVGEEFVGTE